MMTMIVLALACALTLAFALHPLMHENPKTGWRIMAACAVGALGLYLYLGSPDLRSAPAVFETSGARHDARLMTQRELIVMEALSGQPENVKLLLELGTIRIQSGRPDDAIETLQRARTLDPKNPDIAEAIGAAHYNLALTYALQPRAAAQKLAQDHLAMALRITPKSSALYQELKRIQREGLGPAQ